MTEREIAGHTIEVNEEGYCINPEQWNPAIARVLASELKIHLSERHFEVLKMLREKHAAGVALSIRRIGKSDLIGIKEFYQLFPGGPLKISSKIAGIPKPTSCI